VLEGKCLCEIEGGVWRGTGRRIAGVGGDAMAESFGLLRDVSKPRISAVEALPFLGVRKVRGRMYLR
jgi:hypothetical protein